MDSVQDDLITCPLHAIIPCQAGSQELYNKARDAGIPIKHGRYTEEEDKIIRSNFNKFMAKFGWDQRADKKLYIICLLGYRFKDPEIKRIKEEVKKSVNEENFILRLGQGLPDRTLQSIYHRARKLLRSMREAKDLSSKEKKKILKLSSLIGHKWTEIGEIISCDPRVVNDMVRHKVTHKGLRKKYGPFTTEETQTLIDAILYELSLVDITTAVKISIPWERVATHVDGRVAVQCSNHWHTNIAWRIASRNLEELDRILKKQWPGNQLALFIYFLKKSSFNSEEEINWDLIKEKFREFGSLSQLIHVWDQLKEECPESDSNSYTQIVQWLYKHKLPSLIDFDKDTRKKFRKFRKDS